MSMTLISTVSAGSAGISYIDLANIPQTYTDLLILASTRNSASSGDNQTYITINTPGGSGSAITNRYLIGNGSSASSSVGTGQGAIFNANYQSDAYTPNIFSSIQIYIPNYTSNAIKMFSIDSVSENNAQSADLRLIASNLTLTPPITSVQLIAANGLLVQYSNVSIYGILKGSGGADLPVLFYDFVSGTQGWYGNNVSLSTSGGILSTNPIGNDPFIISPSISISGSTNRYVKITFKKSSAGQSATWDGSVFYTTSGHSFDGNYRMAFNEPTWDGNYKTLVFDMHNLTFGGTDWQNNTITSIRIDFSNAQSDGNFLVDSISISPTP